MNALYFLTFFNCRKNFLIATGQQDTARYKVALMIESSNGAVDPNVEDRFVGSRVDVSP